jgi:rare lipoprotein A
MTTKIAILLLVFLVPGIVSGSTSENCASLMHVIKRGDTLWHISKQYGDTVKKLKVRNNLSSDVIHPGEKLIIRTRAGMALASWYGVPFHGRQMANGDIFDMHDHSTVAHKTLPLGTKVRIRNPKNNAEIKVVVRDRGPYVGKREFDLSMAGAEKLGIKERGVDWIEYRVLSSCD